MKRKYLLLIALSTVLAAGCSKEKIRDMQDCNSTATACKSQCEATWSQCMSGLDLVEDIAVVRGCQNNKEQCLTSCEETQRSCLLGENN